MEMNRKQQFRPKAILLVSIIGFLGAFLVPLLGTLDYAYWGNAISSETDLVLFAIFAIICIITLLLGLLLYLSKEKERLGLYASLISLVGLLINGFFLIVGLLLRVDQF